MHGCRQHVSRFAAYECLEVRQHNLDQICKFWPGFHFSDWSSSSLALASNVILLVGARAKRARFEHDARTNSRCPMLAQMNSWGHTGPLMRFRWRRKGAPESLKRLIRHVPSESPLDF